MKRLSFRPSVQSFDHSRGMQRVATACGGFAGECRTANVSSVAAAAVLDPFFPTPPCRISFAH